MSSLGKNAGAAMFAHLLRYGAPLLAYPIMTRTLGIDGFAQFSLILATALLLSQLIEFGFGVMSAREIAQGNKDQRRAIVGEIVLGRVVMALGVIVLYLAGVSFIPVESLTSMQAIAATLFLAMAYGFSSSWYYIGVERAVLLAIQDVVSAVLTLLCVVLFVKTPEDAIIATLAFSVPLWLAVIFGHILAFRDLGFKSPTRASLMKAWVNARHFFVIIAMTPIVNRISILALGVFSSPTQVAFYAAGDKLLTAAINTSIPLVRVLMPRISKLVVEKPKQARDLFIKSTAAIIVAFSVATAVAIYLMPWFVPFFFGKELAGAVPIVMLQMLIITASVSNRSIGMLALLPLKQEKAYQKLVIIVGFISLLVLPIAAYLGEGAGVALSRLAMELLLALVCLTVVIRFGKDWALPSEPKS